MSTRPPRSDPAEQQRSGQPRLSYRAGAWLAAILAAVLTAALSGWLSDWGKSFVGGLDQGPALSAIVDISAPGPSEYALTNPVTSVAERTTLLGGFASSADVMALIARHGGVAVGRLDTTLILEGHRSSLRVVDIRLRMLPSTAEPRAAFLSFPAAGDVPVIQVTADLNHTFPVLESASKPFFASHEIDLARGERESFQASFQAATGFHVFNLSITYIVGGKQYQQTVTSPSGGLFKVAGRMTDYHDYATVYAGMTANQFEVASKSQSCSLFPKSRGC